MQVDARASCIRRRQVVGARQGRARRLGHKLDVTGERVGRHFVCELLLSLLSFCCTASARWKCKFSYRERKWPLFACPASSEGPPAGGSGPTDRLININSHDGRPEWARRQVAAEAGKRAPGRPPASSGCGGGENKNN